MQYADFKIPVYTADGERIGVLATVDGPFMRISRGWLRRSVWIPTEYVASATARAVTVAFESDQLARFRDVRHLSAPEPVDDRKAA